jgi:hypothetical protein
MLRLKFQTLNEVLFFLLELELHHKGYKHAYFSFQKLNQADKTLLNYGSFAPKFRANGR